MATNFTQNVYHLGHLAGRHCHDAYEAITTSYVYNPLHRSSSGDISWYSNLPSYLLTVPQKYKSWWVNLVTEDPVHVVIETVLIAFVVYMLVWRRLSKSRQHKREKLTEEERRELLREWKESGRAGLVPSGETDAAAGTADNKIGTGVVVEKIHGSKMTLRLPAGLEGGSGSSSRRRTSPATSRGERKKAVVLNFATHDFLGMASSDDDASRAAAGGAAATPTSTTSPSKRSVRKIKFADEPVPALATETGTNASSSSSLPSSSTESSVSVKGAARAALNRYGCGSCGPRGFYGTLDAHLDLEDVISDHMNTEGAIMYSDGASAASSTVAAFAKRGDLLIVDEAIYEALNTGVTLSRANVVYFRHNDVEDLRNVLEKIRETDIRLKRNSSDQRRFIVVEGLYKNRGTVPPLDEIAKIKAEFCYRLIVDESFSFGTLGPNGKGALEHFGLTPMVDAEIITLSLENSIGSIGGVCVGSEEVVDHQRLSGAGYCFSASAPPFLASAAIASIEHIKSNPMLLERVRQNRECMYRTIRGPIMKGVVPDRLQVVSDDLSSMVFLELSGEEADASVEEQARILDEIRDRCLRHGVALVSTGDHVTGHLHDVPPPAIRMTVSAVHTEEEIRKAVQVLKDAAVHVFGK